jgi:hypothetical protein
MNPEEVVVPSKIASISRARELRISHLVALRRSATIRRYLRARSSFSCRFHHEGERQPLRECESLREPRGWHNRRASYRWTTRWAESGENLLQSLLVSHSLSHHLRHLITNHNPHLHEDPGIKRIVTEQATVPWSNRCCTNQLTNWYCHNAEAQRQREIRLGLRDAERLVDVHYSIQGGNHQAKDLNVFASSLTYNRMRVERFSRSVKYASCAKRFWNRDDPQLFRCEVCSIERVHDSLLPDDEDRPGNAHCLNPGPESEPAHTIPSNSKGFATGQVQHRTWFRPFTKSGLIQHRTWFS